MDGPGARTSTRLWLAATEKNSAFKPGDIVVRIDPRYYRPAEVETLLGDASLAREKLGWVPKISFVQLVEEMVETDLRLAREESLIDRDRSRP